MKIRRGQTYNPEVDPEAKRLTAGEAEIYIVNFPEIVHKVNKDKKTLVIDDAEYDGPLLASRLTLQQRPHPNTGEYRWLYNGTISYAKDKTDVITPFFNYLRSYCRKDFELEDFYFNNTRLLTANQGDILSQVTVFEGDHKVDYRNEASNTGNTRPLITIDLSAPTLARLNNQPGKQFENHIKGYVFVLNALSQVLGGDQAIKKLAITSGGPLYSTGQKDRYSRKHTKSQQVSEKPSPASPEAEVPVKKMLMLDDIGGLESVKQELKKVVVSFKNPEIMARWGAERPQGIFFYGPGGTGKTSLAQALANEIGGELWEIKSSEIYAKWLGDSEKNMQNIFDQAHQKTKPTVMLFDEFEALVNSVEGEGSGSRAVNGVVGIFKKEIARLRAENPNIIVVATTNYIDKIDDTLIRAGRFDQKHYIPLPDDDARIQIFSNNIADAINTYKTDAFVPFADDINIGTLAAATEGMSGADIVEILRRANFSKAMEEAAGKKASPISQQELLDIIQDMKTD